MDHIEMSIIVEIAEPEVRDCVLNCYRKSIPAKVIQRDLNQRYCPACGGSAADYMYCTKCGQRLSR